MKRREPSNITRLVAAYALKGVRIVKLRTVEDAKKALTASRYQTVGAPGSLSARTCLSR